MSVNMDSIVQRLKQLGYSHIRYSLKTNIITAEKEGRPQIFRYEKGKLLKRVCPNVHTVDWEDVT